MGSSLNNWRVRFIVDHQVKNPNGLKVIPVGYLQARTRSWNQEYREQQSHNPSGQGMKTAHHETTRLQFQRSNHSAMMLQFWSSYLHNYHLVI